MEGLGCRRGGEGVRRFLRCCGRGFEREGVGVGKFCWEGFSGDCDIFGGGQNQHRKEQSLC